MHVLSRQKSCSKVLTGLFCRIYIKLYLTIYGVKEKPIFLLVEKKAASFLGLPLQIEIMEGLFLASQSLLYIHIGKANNHQIQWLQIEKKVLNNTCIYLILIFFLLNFIYSRSDRLNNRAKNVDHTLQNKLQSWHDHMLYMIQVDTRKSLIYTIGAFVLYICRRKYQTQHSKWNAMLHVLWWQVIDRKITSAPIGAWKWDFQPF